MPTISTDEPETITFPAAGRWSCTHVAWLPDERLAPEELLPLAQDGIRRIAAGRLRELGEAALAADELRLTPVSRLGSLDGMALIEALAPSAAARMRRGGRLIDVEVFGTLDEAYSCLWLSLAAARALAQAASGLVVDTGWPRVLPASVLAEPVAPEPQLLLTEHVLVTSTSDERGRGRMATVGLHRLGQPEIEVANVPEDALPGLAALVNGLAWRLQQHVLATPIVSGERLVRVPAEMEVRPEWIAATLGGPLPGGFRSSGAAPPVRLRAGRHAIGTPWISVGPPASWRGSRKAWARHVVDGLLPPRRPAGFRESSACIAPWDA